MSHERQPQTRLRLAERKQYMLDQLRLYGKVEVTTLSESLNVSEVTIRKDLESLEKERLLIRNYGGAVLSENMLQEPSFSEKKDKYLKEKRAIASAAAALIGNGMTIALSTGTTVGYMTHHLRNVAELNVVTNALNIAADLMRSNCNQLYLTGGHTRLNTLAMIGDTAERSLDGICSEYCFVGVNGVSPEQGLMTPSLEESRVVRKMIENSQHAVLLADSSKFQTVSLHHIVGLEKIGTVITDQGVVKEDLNAMKRWGIRTIIV